MQIKCMFELKKKSQQVARSNRGGMQQMQMQMRNVWPKSERNEPGEAASVSCATDSDIFYGQRLTAELEISLLANVKGGRPPATVLLVKGYSRPRVHAPETQTCH